MIRLVRAFSTWVWRQALVLSGHSPAFYGPTWGEVWVEQLRDANQAPLFFLPCWEGVFTADKVYHSVSKTGQMLAFGCNSTLIYCEFFGTFLPTDMTYIWKVSVLLSNSSITWQRLTKERQTSKIFCQQPETCKSASGMPTT